MEGEERAERRGVRGPGKERPEDVQAAGSVGYVRDFGGGTGSSYTSNTEVQHPIAQSSS